MPYGADPATPPAKATWQDAPLVKDDPWRVVDESPARSWRDAVTPADDLPPLVPLSSLKRDVVSVPKGEPRNLSDVKPGQELRVTIPAGTHQAPAPDLPPEADILFNRVRRAEGTASGSGFVYYGGDEFTPGREHPGAAARRPGPKGPTSAAGPGQWEEKTWNGLKPDFREKFGRTPDFSDIGDQRAMTWLNAAKVYPGGEARLREDLKAGKLNTDALAYQWTGFAPDRAGGGNWNVIGAGKWNVSSDALRHGTAIPDAAVQWLDPLDYLYPLGPAEGDAASKSKRQSLARSVNAGEEIQNLPSLDVRREGGKFKVIDYDGRNRAELALQEGIGLIPVVIRGVGKGDKPSEIEGLAGKSLPYDFKPVVYTPPPPPPKPWYERSWDEVIRLAKESAAQTGGAFAGAALGASRPLVGAAQLAGRAGEAIGIPGAESLARGADTATGLTEQAINQLPTAPTLPGGDWSAAIAPTPRNAAIAGDIAATAAIPVSRIGELGTAGRIAAPVATGLVGGAAQPVQPGGDFWPEKALQTAVGGGLGAAGTVASEIGGAGVNALRRVVSPTTVTQAASRLFGENADRLTPEFLAGIRSRTSATLERIETGHDIDLARDTQLLADLDSVKGEARDLLGDEHYGGGAAPIVRAIDGILSRASEDGVIPGKSAATLWHWGSPLDRLTESSNRDVARLAQSAQNAVRGALNRQLPPDEAALYSAARHQWRDLRIVEKTLRPGEVTLDPRRFVTQIYRRFPGQASQPGGPPILQLGRAIGETWPVGGDSGIAAQVAGHIARRFMGHVIGGGAGFALGGPVGGALGTVAGHLAVNALARNRMASPNALLALRPPSAASPPNMNALLALARAAAQRAPVAAAPPISYEIAR